MKKCKHCQIDDIQKIEFCDLLCEKCNKCDYLIFKGNQLELFTMNLIHYYNVGNIKKYYDVSDMSKLEYHALYVFFKKMVILLKAAEILSFAKTRLICTICRG